MGVGPLKNGTMATGRLVQDRMCVRNMEDVACEQLRTG